MASDASDASSISIVVKSKGKGKAKNVIEVSSDDEGVDLLAAARAMVSDDDEELPAAIEIIKQLSGKKAGKLAQAAAEKAVKRIMASRTENLSSDEELDDSLRMIVGTSKRGQKATKAKATKSDKQVKAKKSGGKGKGKDSKAFSGQGQRLDGSVVEDSEENSDSSALSAVSDDADVKPAKGAFVCLVRRLLCLMRVRRQAQASAQGQKGQAASSARAPSCMPFRRY